MPSLEEEFQAAAAKASAKQGVSQPDQLELYSLYKQSTQGPPTASRPGMFDPVGRAKYDAWKTKEGLSKEEAMQAYIDFAETL